MMRFAFSAVFTAAVCFGAASQAAVFVPDLGTSGVANDAELVDGAYISSDAHTGSGALSSTGLGRAAIGGDLTDLDIATATGVSFMAWVKTGDLLGNNGIMMLGACCNPRNGYSLQFNSDGGLRFWGGSDADVSNYNTTASGLGLDDGTWHHVGVRFDSTGLDILVDGSVVASGTAPATGSSPSAAASAANTSRMGVTVPYIGGPNVDGQVSGTELLIDEVSVFGGFLTNAEWADALNGVNTGDLAYYSFDGPTSVPLPAAAPMLVIASAALFGIGRRRRRAA